MNGHDYHCMERCRRIRRCLSSLQCRENPQSRAGSRKCRESRDDAEGVSEKPVQLLRPVIRKRQEAVHGASSGCYSLPRTTHVRQCCCEPQEREAARQPTRKPGMDFVLWERIARLREQIESPNRHQWRAESKSKTRPSTSCGNSSPEGRCRGETTCRSVWRQPFRRAVDTSGQALVAEWPEVTR